MTSTACWWCHDQASMTLIEASITYWRNAVQACYKCADCGALNLAEKNGITPRVKDESQARRYLVEGPLEWRPAGPKYYPGVPEEIASAASEAYACMSAEAHRGAILIARSVIEATAKANDVTKGRLLDKIDEMRTVGLIRAHVREGAHEVRWLGNEMAHGDFAMPVNETDARMTVGLMDDVLEEIYVSKARVNSRIAWLRDRHAQEPSETTPRLRVYEVAAELGVPTAEIIDRLAKMGVPVRSATSLIGKQLAKDLKDAYRAPKAATAPPEAPAT